MHDQGRDRETTKTPADHAELLGELAETYSVLVDPRTVPTPGSPAEREVAGAREHTAGGQGWGEEPVRLTHELALASYVAALDQALAMAVLMRETTSVTPVVVLARVVAEAASQAWWLLEPGISFEQRVRRMLAIRYRSALQGEQAAAADGAASADFGRYTETADCVVTYAICLGLDQPKRDGYAHCCGNERLQSPSRLVVEMFAEVDVPSVYNIHSGFLHAEVFALLQAYRLPFAQRWAPDMERSDLLAGATAVAGWSLHQPGARLTSLFGLSSSEG